MNKRLEELNNITKNYLENYYYARSYVKELEEDLNLMKLNVEEGTWINFNENDYVLVKEWFEELDYKFNEEITLKEAQEAIDVVLENTIEYEDDHPIIKNAELVLDYLNQEAKKGEKNEV